MYVLSFLVFLSGAIIKDLRSTVEYDTEQACQAELEKVTPMFLWYARGKVDEAGGDAAQVTVEGKCSIKE